jgi:hypothetical protein
MVVKHGHLLFKEEQVFWEHSAQEIILTQEEWNE